MKTKKKVSKKTSNVLPESKAIVKPSGLKSLVHELTQKLDQSEKNLKANQDNVRELSFEKIKLKRQIMRMSNLNQKNAEHNNRLSFVCKYLSEQRNQLADQLAQVKAEKALIETKEECKDCDDCDNEDCDGQIEIKDTKDSLVFEGTLTPEKAEKIKEFIESLTSLGSPAEATH